MDFCPVVSRRLTVWTASGRCAIELRQLRYFVALAEELNYRAAAERLRISKPTLSQQIGVLERSLGATLLERGPRAVALTAAGEVLLEQARQVLSACDRLRDAVTSAGATRPALDVRVANGVEHVVARPLRALQLDPQLRVDLTVTSGRDAEDAVTGGRADAALVWAPAEGHVTLHAEQVAAASVALAVPVGSSWEEYDEVPVAALAAETIALFPRRVAPGVWDAFARHLLPGGRQPDQLLEETDTLLPMLGMLRAVEQRRAVAPFVTSVATTLAPAGVVLRPLDPPLELPVFVLCREPTRPDIRRLLAVLRTPV